MQQQQEEGGWGGDDDGIVRLLLGANISTSECSFDT
eukprot:gene6364-2917_t